MILYKNVDICDLESTLLFPALAICSSVVWTRKGM